ncbi:hypothetical protein WJX81_008108 [Elliptochloris bilobata]|uniref:Uncharacterized protein n=1 Tax=Elliptochloris bilobata TaxID=381761 RepID=A0AAW1RDV7_9CHLO
MEAPASARARPALASISNDGVLSPRATVQREGKAPRAIALQAEASSIMQTTPSKVLRSGKRIAATPAVKAAQPDSELKQAAADRDHGAAHEGKDQGTAADDAHLLTAGDDTPPAPPRSQGAAAREHYPAHAGASPASATPASAAGGASLEPAALAALVQELRQVRATPPGYVPRRKATPYMDKKLAALQAKEWGGAGGAGGKLHKSKVQLAKEAAAASRKSELSDTDKALVRRMVRGAVANAVASEGKDLRESMVVHKSRLEREKEAAAAAAKERSAAGARSGSVPGYMRATSAFASKLQAKEPGLSAMKVHKSRLERERDAAAAAAAARGGASAPASTRSAVAASLRAGTAPPAQGGSGLGDMRVRKSRLEREKEAAAAAAAASDGPNPRTPHPFARGRAGGAAAAAGGGAGGLGDMRVHKSRLEREREAWVQAAARGSDSGRAGASSAAPHAAKPALIAAALGAAASSATPAAAGGGSGGGLPAYAKPTSASKARVGKAPAPVGSQAFDYVPN